MKNTTNTTRTANSAATTERGMTDAQVKAALNAIDRGLNGNAPLPAALESAARDLVALVERNEVWDCIAEEPAKSAKAIAAALRLIRASCDVLETQAQTTIAYERGYAAARLSELKDLTM